MKIYAGQATGSFAVDGELNVTGSIVVSGLVDGIDLQSLSSSLDTNKASVTELSDVSGALALAISNISTDFADITNKPTLISSSLQFNTLDTPFTGSFTGSFYGDGSNLSGVTSYTDADTLSFIQGYSGSYSGSFTGDGSGLTNLPFDNATTASFSATSSITVTHNLGSKSVSVDVYDSSDTLILPQLITLVDDNNVKVDFAGTTSGFVVITKGGHLIQGTSTSAISASYSSYATSASYASTASYVEYSGINNVPAFATTGSNNFVGDQTITGSLVTSGSKVEFNVAWPVEGSEQHIIKTEPFIVSSSQGLKSFGYGALALEHHTEDGGYEHNAFKLYMYDDHTNPSYGSEILLGPVRAQMTINASGSNALGNISTQDVGDGTTRTLLYGNLVQLGAVLTDDIIIGNETAAVEISGSSIGISGSTTIAGDLDVTGKITAQEFHTEYVSSSIVYQSGSTKFGDTSDDIHQFTGSVAVTGGVTGSVKATGHIIPSENNLYDLGSPTNQFRHLYLSTASLYMDGTKILSSNADVLTFTTDVGQSIKILETGLDDITLQTDAGNIELKGTVEIASGKKIIDSAGTVIQFGDSLGVTGSIQVSGTVDGIDLQLMSSSLATRVSDVESFSSSLNSNFATDAELSAVSGALAASIAGISTDFADITNKPTLISSSAQFTDSTAPFTGSFSGSFYGDGSNLSGVTSYTDADTLAYINSLNVVSGSFTSVSTVSDTFTSATSHTVTHNFGTKEVIVSVYENDILIFPSTISTPTENTVTVSFPEAVTGRVVVVKAGHIVSGSIEFNNVLNKPTLISSSAQIAADISGSFSIASSSLAQRISSQEEFSSSLNSVFTTDAELSALSSSIVSRLVEDESSISSLNSATSSYLLNTTDTLVGDLTVTGKVTAQEFHTEYVSSSIVYQSGSTKFGDTSDDVHQFTGSLNLLGSGVRINRNTSGEPYLFFEKDNVVRGSIYGVTNGGLRFFNNLDEQVLTITGSNVGINESQPSYNLHVAGTLRASGNTSIGGTVTAGSYYTFSDWTTGTVNKIRGYYDNDDKSIQWNYNNSPAGTVIKDNNSFLLNINNTDTLYADSSGNISLGKGSQSGNAALTVKSLAGGNTGIILIEGDTANDGYGLYATTDNKFIITRFTNGSYNDYFTVDSSGKVGIGTVDPSSRFTVKSPGNSVFPLVVTNTSNVMIGGFYQTGAGSGQLYLYDASSNENVKISTIDDSYFNGGKVGIGTTSPNFKLSVNENSNFSQILMAGASAPTLDYNDKSRFRITNPTNAYVGIRTNSSGYKYVRIEADLKNPSSGGTDHFGFFWGADQDNLGLSTGVSGYKWVWRNGVSYINLRDINTNTDLSTSSTIPFAYNDGNWHHWVVEVTPTGVYISVDGTVILTAPSTYSVGGYCGLLVYAAGYMDVSNFNITSLSNQYTQIYTSTTQLSGFPAGYYYFSNSIGQIQLLYYEDGYILVASNNASSSTLPLATSRNDNAYRVNRNGTMGHLGTPSPDSDYLIGGWVDNFSFSGAKIVGFGYDSTNGTYSWSNKGNYATATWNVSSFDTVVASGNVTAGGNIGYSAGAAYFVVDAVRKDASLNANANQTTIGGAGVSAASGDPSEGCYFGHGNNEGTISCEGWYGADNVQRDSQGWTTWLKS